VKYSDKNVLVLILIYITYLLYRLIRLLLLNGSNDFWVQEYSLNVGLFWYYISISILILLYSLNHMIGWLNVHERFLIGLLVIYLPFSIPIIILIICRGFIDFEKKPSFGLFHARYLIAIVPSILLLYLVFSIPLIHKAFSIQKTQDVVEVQFDTLNFNLHGENGYINGIIELYFQEDELYKIKVELELPNGSLESSEAIKLFVNGEEVCEGQIVSDKLLFSKIVELESSDIAFMDNLVFTYSFENVAYEIVYSDWDRYEITMEYQIFDLN